MIDQTQSELAKSFLEQSRNAAQQSYGAWEMVMKSQKAMLDSMRSSGAPFALAADQYEKLIAYQSQQYKGALDYIDKMITDYQQQLNQHQK